MDLPYLSTTGSRAEIGFVDETASNSRPQTITASGSTNTKGSWVEIFGGSTLAVASNSYGMLVSVCPFSASTRDFLIDIGIGGAGSEQVLVSNLIASVTATNNTWCHHIYIPIGIAIGTRVSVRCQSTAASATCMVQILLLSGGFIGHTSCRRCQTLGAATGDSGGTQIDAGGTAGTKGSYVQIPSSTTTDLAGRQLLIGVGNVANGGRVTANFLLDVAIGGAGSEQVVLSNLHINTGANGVPLPTLIGPIPVSIPQGSQLSARCNSSTIDATDRLLDIVYYVFG